MPLNPCIFLKLEHTTLDQTTHPPHQPPLLPTPPPRLALTAPNPPRQTMPNPTAILYLSNYYPLLIWTPVEQKGCVLIVTKGFTKAIGVSPGSFCCC